MRFTGQALQINGSKKTPDLKPGIVNPIIEMDYTNSSSVKRVNKFV